MRAFLNHQHYPRNQLRIDGEVSQSDHVCMNELNVVHEGQAMVLSFIIKNNEDVDVSTNHRDNVAVKNKGHKMQL
jgi:hypothetical protein